MTEPPTLITPAGLDITVQPGGQVQLSWAPPSDVSRLAFYQIRKAPIISGKYSVMVSLSPRALSHTWTIGTTGFFCFVTAYHRMPDPVTGILTTQESTGTNIVRVRIAT